MLTLDTQPWSMHLAWSPASTATTIHSRWHQLSMFTLYATFPPKNHRFLSNATLTQHQTDGRTRSRCLLRHPTLRFLDFLLLLQRRPTQKLTNFTLRLKNLLSLASHSPPLPPRHVCVHLLCVSLFSNWAFQLPLQLLLNVASSSALILQHLP